MARTERVASIARQTAARRSMIHHTTLCIETTSAWAWVHTFVSYTCLCSITVCVENTLRATACIRITRVFRKTGAWPSTITFLAHSICTTWWWIARITWSLNWVNSWKFHSVPVVSVSNKQNTSKINWKPHSTKLSMMQKRANTNCANF